jgi:hypothetical protein
MSENKVELETDVVIALAGQVEDSDEMATIFKVFVVSHWARTLATDSKNPKQEDDKKISGVGC